MKCSVLWCLEKATQKKYCDRHGYHKECQIIGCNNTATKNHSLCSKHYRERPDLRKEIPKEERFWNFIKKTVDCWIWTGAKSTGYGFFWDGQGPIHAHIYSYVLCNHTIPKRLYHTCKNRLCCNPEHLSLINPRKIKP